MSSHQSGNVNLTPAMIANIRATMMNLEGFTVNWAGVREATGVSNNGNAAQGFRNAMKAFGLKVIDAKAWKFGNEHDEAPAAVNTPATLAITKKRGRPKNSESPEAKRKKVATPKKEGEADKLLKQEDGTGKEGVDAAEEK